jgi:predicted nucleic-acid-binding protein
MLAADTNVLVRLLTNDDAAQGARARALFEREAIFVAKTVLLEAEWVLRSAYGYTAPEVREALVSVIRLPKVVIEDLAAIQLAIDWFEQGMDFADALHLASARHCEGFATFDRRLARSAANAGSPPIVTP